MTSRELPPDDALRSLASQILARPEYAQFRPFDESWVHSLRDLYLHFRSWVDGLDLWTYALLLGGLVLLLGVLVFHIVWSLRTTFATAPSGSPHPRHTRALSLDAEARRLAEQGSFLEAAHQMHLACIDRLLRDRVLELHRHDPNRTLRKRLEGSSMGEDLKHAFVSRLGRLERRWFRDHSADPSDRELYHEWRDLLERIESAARVP